MTTAVAAAMWVTRRRTSWDRILITHVADFLMKANKRTKVTSMIKTGINNLMEISTIPMIFRAVFPAWGQNVQRPFVVVPGCSATYFVSIMCVLLAAKEPNHTIRRYIRIFLLQKIALQDKGRKTANQRSMAISVAVYRETIPNVKTRYWLSTA